MRAPDPTAIVFVVDDDEAIRSLLACRLEHAGWTVETFDSAAAFLERTMPSTAHCLVLDVEMPGMSGLDLQERMADRYEGTPVIFITGHGDVPMSVRAMKAGALEFFTKPFDMDALVAAIARAITQSHETLARRAEQQLLIERRACLSPREREVMNLVVTGLPNKQIAITLDITESTVKAHRGQVMVKMKADSLPELVLMARRMSR